MSTTNYPLAAAQVDLTVASHTTPILKWTIYDSDGATVDLTGYTVTMTVHTTENPDSSELWHLAATNANQTTEPGVCRISLTATQTAYTGVADQPSRLAFALEATTAGGEAYLAAYGVYQVRLSGGRA